MTKTGRPLAGSERRDITVRLRMEAQEVKRLEACAAALKTTRSGVIREGLKLVERELEGRERG